MAILLGIDGQALYSVQALEDGVPTWLENELAKDVTSTIEDREADISNRSSPWGQFRGTIRDVTVEFQMEYDPADQGFIDMQNAWILRNKMAFWIADGPAATSGTQGVQFDGTIMTFSRPEALEDSMKIDVTIRPVDSATAPDWVKL